MGGDVVIALKPRARWNAYGFVLEEGEAWLGKGRCQRRIRSQTVPGLWRPWGRYGMA